LVHSIRWVNVTPAQGVILRGLTSQGSPSRPIWEAALAGTQVILGVTLAARADRNAGEPQVYLMSLGAPEHFAAKIGEIGNATAMLPSEPRAKGILLLDLLAVRENH
jgi:hypothetical protein